MNREFARSGSPPPDLITNFRWTDDDQNQVARDINRGRTPDEAAARWLDANPTVWKEWLG